MLARIVQTIRQKNYEYMMGRYERQGKLTMNTQPRVWIATPVEMVTFMDNDLAQRWAQDHGIAKRHIHIGRPHHFDPQVMSWVLKMRREGIKTGELRAHIVMASADNFDELLSAFQREHTSPRTAFDMLQMAFALNRPEGAQAIANWAQKNPQSWFDPNALVGPDDDPQAQHFKLDSAVCLFGRLMRHPALLTWLFEHQLAMKHQLQEPQQWNALQDKLRTGIDPMFVTAWPATAHQVFRADVSPLQPNWPVDNFSFVVQAIPAFSHNRAAQCYLVYQYINQRISEMLVAQACPEAIELYHRLQLALNPKHVHPSDAPAFDNDVVDGLMIGVHLGLDHESFYYHAQGVFSATQRKSMDMNYENLDADLFQTQRQ